MGEVEAFFASQKAKQTTEMKSEKACSNTWTHTLKWEMSFVFQISKQSYLSQHTTDGWNSLEENLSSLNVCLKDRPC